jgi:hypothetical protein
VVWVGVAITALIGLHLLATWAESRGWIYYRKTSPRGYGVAIANAVAAFEASVNPAAEHRIEEEHQPEGWTGRESNSQPWKPSTPSEH